MEIPEAFEKILKANKLIAETSFKISLEKKNAGDIEYLKAKLETLTSEKEKFLLEFGKGGLELFVPFQDKIDELSNRLGSFGEDQIIISMRKKNGTAWDIMQERSVIVKNNMFHAKVLGKFMELLTTLDPETRKKISTAVKKGSFEEPIEIINKDTGEKMAKFLSRIGIGICYENRNLVKKTPEKIEKGVKVGSVVVYVDENTAKEIEKDEKDLFNVSLKVQVMNAEKQMKKYDEEEMRQFEALQKQYLELLKKREENIKKYYDL